MGVARLRREPPCSARAALAALAGLPVSVALLVLALLPGPLAAQGQASDSPPPAPDPPTVFDNGLRALSVTWTKPDNASPVITGYDLEYRRRDSSDWLPGPQDQTGTSVTISGLEPDKNYYVRVRAQNSNGAGEWSEAGEGTTALYVGTMTTGEAVKYRGYRRFRGEPYGGDNSLGELVPRSLSYDGDEYLIITMAWCICVRDGQGGQHTTAVDLYSLFNEIPDEWVLRVGDLRLLLSDATRADLGRTGLKSFWPHISPGWEIGRQYEVSFSRNPLLSSNGSGIIRGPLTAEMRQVPGTHDGSSAFQFALRFSEDVKNRREDIIGGALTVVGGSITDASQRNEPSHRVWQVTVRPDGAEPVSITLQANRDCETSGAVCTEDGRELSQTITKVIAGPKPPLISGQSHFSFAENNAGVVARFTASDPDTHRLTWQSPAGVDAAVFTMDSSGDLRFRRAPDFEAPADADADNVFELIVRVSDGLQLATHEVTVAVTDRNEPPTAVDDEARTLEDQPVTIDVLGNDIDPDAGDMLTLRVLTASNGTARIGNDHTVVFTPMRDYHGDGRLIYEIADSQGLTATATAQIEIESANDPPRFPLETANRTVAERDGEGDRVGAPLRAIDVDGDALAYRIFGPDEFTIDASTGQIRVGPGVVFDPASRDSYLARVEADDGQGGSASIDVTITVTSVAVATQADQSVDGVGGSEHRAPSEEESAPSTSTGAGGGFGGGGGGGAPPVSVPSEADFDWNVTRDIEPLARVHDEPTGMWSDGDTLWLLQNAASGGDRVFAYDLATGERIEGREFELDRRNRFAHGLWSDGETVWISDSGQDRVFVYKLATGERDEPREFALNERNRDPRGIWSNGETIFVLDAVKDALFSYDLDAGPLIAEHALDSLNRSPRGIWSDGLVIWVSDDGANRVFAYRLEEEGLNRIEDEEFDFRVLLKAGAGDARGVWSDGDTLWLADAEDAQVYSFNLPDAIQAQLASLSLSDLDLDFSARRLSYALDLPRELDATTVSARATQEIATISIKPFDADLNSENGHQVRLSGVGALSITVTSADGSRSWRYTVKLRRPTCFDGFNRFDEQRLSRVVFAGGSLDELKSCALQHSLTAVYHFDGQTWRGLFLDAPDFLSRPFHAHFADGIPAASVFIAARESTTAE